MSLNIKKKKGSLENMTKNTGQKSKGNFLQDSMALSGIWRIYNEDFANALETSDDNYVLETFQA